MVISMIFVICSYDERLVKWKLVNVYKSSKDLLIHYVD